MCYRGAIMSQAVFPIRKKFLHCHDVPMADKLHVVSSLVLSEGLHLAGTWPALLVELSSHCQNGLRCPAREKIPAEPEGTSQW